MTTKFKVITSVSVIVVAFAFGRYSAPEKIKIEKQIVEVEKKTKDTESEKNKHKHTKVTEIVRPDGTKETTTEIIEDSQSEHKSNETAERDKTTSESKEVTKSGAAVRVMIMSGIDVTNIKSMPFYGANISANVLGPISIGLFGLTNGTGGGMIGISF